MVAVLMVGKRECWICGKCRWAWFPRQGKDGKTITPKQCPNGKCRARFVGQVEDEKV
jgi:hypothetical protein